MNNDVKENVQNWLQQAVIGLNLCPFASHPFRNGAVHFEVCNAQSDENVLSELQKALLHINQHNPEEVETSLLILTSHFEDFHSFNAFLSLVDLLLKEQNWEGKYQVASFHPLYQFAGTHTDDAENLTNRAPYPILHIIREASLDMALANYPAPDAIYQRNIDTMNNLSKEEKQQIFPYQK